MPLRYVGKATFTLFRIKYKWNFWTWRNARYHPVQSYVDTDEETEVEGSKWPCQNSTD